MVKIINSRKAWGLRLLRMAEGGDGQASRELLAHFADNLGALDEEERDALAGALRRLAVDATPASAFRKDGHAALSGTQNRKGEIEQEPVYQAVDALIDLNRDNPGDLAWAQDRIAAALPFLLKSGEAFAKPLPALGLEDLPDTLPATNAVEFVARCLHYTLQGRWPTHRTTLLKRYEGRVRRRFEDFKAVREPATQTAAMRAEIDAAERTLDPQRFAADAAAPKGDKL